MFLHRAAAVLFLILSVDVSSSRGSNLSGAELTRLYNSPVYEAEWMVRPLGSMTKIKGLISHSGIRVTLRDRTTWLIHKGKSFGDSYQTVVTAAQYMSNSWRSLGSKNFNGRKIVNDFVRVGGGSYNVLFDNCHWATFRMFIQ